MRFSWYGSLCQSWRGTEGSALVQLGLLRLHGLEWAREIEPIERLGAMFDASSAGSIAGNLPSGKTTERFALAMSTRFVSHGPFRG